MFRCAERASEACCVLRRRTRGGVPEGHRRVKKCDITKIYIYIYVYPRNTLVLKRLPESQCKVAGMVSFGATRLRRVFGDIVRQQRITTNIWVVLILVFPPRLQYIRIAIINVRQLKTLFLFLWQKPQHVSYAGCAKAYYQVPGTCFFARAATAAQQLSYHVDYW